VASSRRPNFEPSDIGLGFRAERNQSLHLVLRGLPRRFVVGLIEGLEMADVITPGRLFTSSSGGCAVGVTLRALDPSLRGRRLQWGRRRSVVGWRRELAKEIPLLFALEQVFDRTVRLARRRYPHAPEREVAKAVALWVADEARTELLMREMHAEWLEELVREARRPPAAEGCGAATQPAPVPA
jgi:hypothetical protein